MNQDSEGDLFEKTNPHFGQRRNYKKIVKGEGKTSRLMPIRNIFDPQIQSNRLLMGLKEDNPEELPLGGRAYFQSLKQRADSGHLYSSCEDIVPKTSKKEEGKSYNTVVYRTERRQQPKLETLQQLKHKTTHDEEYKSHSKTHATISNKTTTQGSRPFRSGLSEIHKPEKNKLFRLYERAQRLHFERVAMIGQLDYRQPLEKRYGDRYFQYMLRDRYKDDDKFSHGFLHQLRKNQLPSKSALQKAILNQGIKIKRPQYLQLLGVSKQVKEYATNIQ